MAHSQGKKEINIGTVPEAQAKESQRTKGNHENSISSSRHFQR